MNFFRSRPARGAWIETNGFLVRETNEKSRPARGAWIETERNVIVRSISCVAPRTGRVD